MKGTIRARRRERGIALVLVMTVVLALAIVATPFVLSMLLQERSGTLARYESQADYGADGARNYALWRLMLSIDPIERRAGAGAGAFQSYYWDNAQEFDIRLDDIYLSKNAKVTTYPEANVLVPRRLDAASGTPAFKSVVARLETDDARGDPAARE